MDRTEVIRSLARMFEEPEENDYVIEEKQIDKKRYLALVTKDRDDLIQTHPDYEALIAIMQHYNTKNLNYAVKKLNDNKRKFFVEYTDSEREKFLDETRYFCKRLIGTNAMALPLLESVIVEWVDNLLKTPNLKMEKHKLQQPKQNRPTAI